MTGNQIYNLSLYIHFIFIQFFSQEFGQFFSLEKVITYCLLKLCLIFGINILESPLASRVDFDFKCYL